MRLNCSLHTHTHTHMQSSSYMQSSVDCIKEQDTSGHRDGF